MDSMSSLRSTLEPSQDEKQQIEPMAQPSYSLAGQDLSHAWVQLVQGGKVSATIMRTNNQDEEEEVRYGVCWKNDQCQPFVEGDSSGIQDMRRQLEEHPEPECIQKENGFVAQLQLVRTLRPPPSFSPSGDGDNAKVTSTPPPYDAATDSFVTGPLRLALRPVVATLATSTTTTTPWQVFHNVSPASAQGHFLLIPTLEDADSNWRAQALTASDCQDLGALAATNVPAGSLLIGFNSVGGGASQNHIHAHAWPSSPYAVTQVGNLMDFMDCSFDDGNSSVVEVSWLEYPVCCLEASSTDVTALGRVVHAILETIREEAPVVPSYNVGWMNRCDPEDGTTYVDAFVFIRSFERSPQLPGLKLGVSEMMGVFHAQSREELEFLGGNEATMPSMLEDISYPHQVKLWEAVQERLQREGRCVLNDMPEHDHDHDHDYEDE